MTARTELIEAMSIITGNNEDGFYFYRAFPCRLDAASERFVQIVEADPNCYFSLEEGEARTLVAYTLNAFSIRMAGAVVRNPSIYGFHMAVLALACAADILYWKDVMLGLYVLRDCADRCGYQLCESANQLDGRFDDLRRILKSYPDDQPFPHSLKDLGARADGEGADFHYSIL